jgi:site-specific recombinase XerD
MLTACGSSSAVECLLAKEEVASSNLVFRSKKSGTKHSNNFTEKFQLQPRSKNSQICKRKYQLQSGSKYSQNSQRFTEELFTLFMQSRPQGLSKRTIESYHYTLKDFEGFSISPEGINSYLSDLSCGNGKLKFYTCLKTLCNWLWQTGHIKENPILRVSPPRIQKRLLPAVTKTQLDNLLSHCHSERDKALISLLWHSGMRISEAINAKSSDFNWDEGTITVLGKGNRYRKALAGNGMVKQWFANHESFELNQWGAQTMLRRLSAETGTKCNPHSFRRGFCVHQVKSGLSTRVVQALGGWETISMVERYSKSLSFDEALDLYNHKNL